MNSIYKYSIAFCIGFLSVSVGTPFAYAQTDSFAVTLTPSATTLSVGDTLGVAYNVVGTSLPNSWIGLYKVGASDNAYSAWKYVQGGSGSVDFTLPAEGTYELRYFKGGGYDKGGSSQQLTVTKPAEQAFAVTFTIPSTPHMVGDELTFTWALAGTVTPGSWIGLYKAGATDNSYLAWKNAAGTSGAMSFTLPAEGVYEMRYFKGGGYDKGGTSQQLTVTKPAEQAFAVTFTIPSTPHMVGDELTFTWALTGTVTSGSWIGLYKAGAADNSYLAWKNAAGASGAMSFTLPAEGVYEMRYFNGNTYHKGGTSESITVTKAVDVPSHVTLTFSSTTFAVGDNLAVNWNVAGTVTSGSWIGLYKAGAADTAYTSWRFVPGVTGVATFFSLPAEGTYEVRYFKGNTYDKVATSVPITVVKGVQSFTVTVNPTRAVIGETVNVSWVSTNTIVRSIDWIGLFESGTGNNSYIKWRYTAFRDGDAPFVIEQPGVYEFRYMRGAEVLGSSAAFSVTNTITDVSLIKNYPPKNKTIIAFGDSLTQGVGAPAGSDYVTQLSALLGTPITNAGVSRNTSAQALARIQTDVLDKNPGIVIVLLGGNDLLQNIPTSETNANLQQIITKIHQSGAVVVLVGVQGGLYSDRFQEMYHSLALANATVFIPNILRGIIGNPFLLGDLVHPNTRGYMLVAERIFPSMQKLLAGL